MRHLNPGSATKINQQNPVQAAWWTLREDSEIQLIHGRIKHNSTEILRSDVRKNVATMNLSFNTRAGSNPVSGLHQETRCYHWITRVISIMCHVMSGSRDSCHKAAAVLSLIVTRDIIRDRRDSPRISCPDLVCLRVWCHFILFPNSVAWSSE